MKRFTGLFTSVLCVPMDNTFKNKYNFIYLKMYVYVKNKIK